MDAQTTQTVETLSAARPVLYMAIELAEAEWKVAFSDGRPKPRIVTVPGRDLEELSGQISRARSRFGLADDCRVVSCFEAGRDGFWLHRFLESIGVDNLVVDPASIEISRRRRRAKTDRIDVRKLMNRLIRHHLGEPELWSVVRVPSLEDEDARELHREIDVLQKETHQHRQRITCLLVKTGVRLDIDKDFPRNLTTLRLWDGSRLPLYLEARLRREYQRLRQADQQLRKLRALQRQLFREANSERVQKVVHLYLLRGVGVVGAWVLVMELFGWRVFNNRKQLAGAVGLTGTPFDSGESEHEQGISKIGNARVRKLLVELAWLWLRLQPDSKLTKWFNEKFGTGKRRRKVGIVALARRLLIDLWRFVERGVVPEGALLKA